MPRLGARSYLFIRKSLKLFSQEEFEIGLLVLNISFKVHKYLGSLLKMRVN